MPQNSRLDWRKKIQEKHPSDDGFLSHWDFKNADKTQYYTVDPFNVPEEWKDLSNPRNVFEVPEVWYNVERKVHPTFDNWAWHEVEFCKKLWEKYSENPVQSVFEVCCGICPHGSILARQGINVVGVDSSEGMVKAACIRAETQKLPLKAYKRDVFQFSIPGSPPDAAILLGGTFPLSRNNRTDNAALVSQLRSVGTFLKRGTIYIIDCGIAEIHPLEKDYSMSQPWSVDIEFATVTLTKRTFPTDLETLSTPYITGYDVKYPKARVRLEHRGALSYVSAQHLAALVEMSLVFELLAFHNWGRIEQGITRDGGPYVAVLRRK